MSDPVPAATPLPARSPRKPRGQGAVRRGEILEAARRLFVIEGFDRATIRRIAAAVGLSSAALYIYFPDKDAILRTIAEETFVALLEALRRSQPPDAGPAARLRAGFEAYVAFGRAHPDGYRLTFLTRTIIPSAPGRPCKSPDGIEAADRSFAILRDCVAEGMAQGAFRSGDATAMAEALWAAMHGATLLLLDHLDHLESAPETLVRSVVALVLDGLLATRSNDH